MPVTTTTFRKQNTLHIIFALSSIGLALSVIWGVLEDWNREFRGPQIEERQWDLVMTTWDTNLATLRATMTNVEAMRESLAKAQAKVDANPEYAELGQKINRITVERDELRKELQLEVDGNIAPTQQRVERLQTLIQTNEGSEAEQRDLARLKRQYDELVTRKREGENRINQWEREIAGYKAQRREIESEVSAIRESIKATTETLAKDQAKLEALDPGALGRLGNWMRNMALLDAFNPSIRVKQQLVPNVLTDVNLKQVPTLDRCMSCHTTIDNPQFAEDRILRFLEFQALSDAMPVGKNQRALDVAGAELSPVAILDYWERVITQIDSESGAPLDRLKTAQAALTSALTGLLSAEDSTLASAWKGENDGQMAPVSGVGERHAVFELLLQHWPDDWRSWYAPFESYALSLREIVDESIDSDDQRLLMDSYRHALIASFNSNAWRDDRKKLSSDRLILAHPRLDLFAHPDSKHSIAAVGCTSCHDGGGEETQFRHTAHSPQDIWVDARSGAFVPRWLVAVSGDDAQITRFLLESKTPSRTRRAPVDQTSDLSAATIPGRVDETRATVVLASHVSDEEAIDAQGGSASEESSHGAALHEGEWFHDDQWYTDRSVVADPFSPNYVNEEDHAAAYIDPATGDLSRAVKQAQRWTDELDWHHVEFHYWERPMHTLTFVESSCSRCHTEEIEIEEQAPRLAEGRLLFTKLGCVNCHAVDALGSPVKGNSGHPDVRQVGPSLIHVRDKLSEGMIASWTWSPRAFRPNTRMPHFFMAENNSSPLDIRRTRAEVAAIAAYLVRADLKPGDVSYNPEPIPEVDANGTALNTQGDVSAGRELFKEVGCLACHSNVNETGLDWVLIDLQERFGLDRAGAMERISEDAVALGDTPGEEAPEENVGFFELDGQGQPTGRIKPSQYIRLQWYLMAHQQDRYTRVAPDLSGIGTKLLNGRTRDQAHAWVYDWVRNPSHYSDYSIMPSLRLSEQEALNIGAYLLDQKHPSYEAEMFEADEPMIDALLVNLQRNAISEQAARDLVSGMSLDEKQLDLGQRMIQHYGCFGCHQISGFDSTLAVSANLSAYGKKDPHKLDFGYFEHIFAHSRPRTVDVWAVEKEGTTPDAVGVTHADRETDLLHKRALQWEPVPNDRRGYIYAKLHDPRIFNRNKISFDGAMTEDGAIVYTSKRDGSLRLERLGDQYVDLESGQATDLTAEQVEIRDVGEPYLKLRMPRFFLHDDEIVSLVTYVTSLRPTLITGDLDETSDDARHRRAMGRLMAEAFNCLGCHDIENNEPNVRQYYEVRGRDGSVQYLQTLENLPNAPPRIVGNGAKAQHDWFYAFLNDVQMLRPWLKIRMPSFHLDDEQTTSLVEFLAGSTTILGREIDRTISGVDSTMQSTFAAVYDEAFQQAISEGNNAAKADELAKAQASTAAGALLLPEDFADTRNKLVALGREYGLYSPSLFPTREFPESERARMYGKIWYDLRFLRGVYRGVDYPFELQPGQEMSPEEFALGESLVKELQCFKCHRLGDWDKLERIFDIEQKALGVGGDDFEGEEDPYGDADEDPYGADEDPYGADEDPYGSDEDPYGADEDPYGSDEGDSAAPAAPTLYDSISAPNLALLHERLQPDYVRQWLRKPAAIMPGTKMPNHWGADGKVSAFAAYPEAARRERELLYGNDAEAQIDLITRWFFAAGARQYTVDEHLLGGDGAESAAPISLDDLKAMKLAEAEARGETIEIPTPTETPVETGVTVETAPAKPVETKAMTPEEQAADREAAVSEIDASGAEADRGAIVGVINWDGPRPRMRPIRINANAMCVAVNGQRGTRPTDETIVVNGNGSLRDVVVSIVNAPGGSNPLDGPQHVSQQGCVYKPHVLSITTGRTLTIHNGDPGAHNVSFASLKNGTFNESQPVSGMEKEVKFNTPEMGARLKCDIHSWMNALVYIFDNPYHTVSNDRGVYKIAGLPAGEYEVVFTHAKLGEQTQTVTVSAGASARVDVTYSR